MFYEKVVAIDRKIALLQAQQDKEATLVDVTSSIQKFDSVITRISVDVMATKKMIKGLEKEKAVIAEQVIRNVKQDNPLVSELHELISSYAIRLGLDERYVSARKDYIFTNDLKSLTGAIFHKVVFAFKISYVRLIHRHTGVCLPIILDSPSGREVSSKNVNEIIAVLEKDFSEHQIIIASIHNDYALTNKNLIELKDRLLPF
jgi:hypothetical protein